MIFFISRRWNELRIVKYKVEYFSFKFYLFDKYIVNIYYIVGMVLGISDIMGNKIMFLVYKVYLSREDR